MELTQLKYFCAVARTENITAAAKDLYISQPTLSQTIARLEASVGVKLFIREKGKLRLSAAGRAFLSHAESVLSEVENAVAAARKNSDYGASEICVAGAASELLNDALAEFLKDKENVRVRSYLLTNAGIYSMLSEMRLDFAVSIDPPIFDNNIEWTPLLEEPIYVILSSEHPLANTGSIPMKQLRNERFLSFDNEVDRNYTQYLCNNIGRFSPNICMISNEISNILDGVGANLGIAFMHAHELVCIKALRSMPNLCFARVTEPDYHCSVGILRVKDRAIAGYAEQMLQLTAERMRGFSNVIAKLPDCGCVRELYEPGRGIGLKSRDRIQSQPAGEYI